MSSLQNIFSESDNSRRAGLISGITVIILIAIVALYWVFSEKYEVLFSGLEMRDASAIVDELDKNKIDYIIGDGGKSILVPDEQVHKVRIQMMGSDIPMAGTLGFELFNDSEFGMTEFAQKVNYQRALQGELTRTIMSLQEVKFARIHLVLPENSLFNTKAKKPSASVTLFLKGDMIPDSGQITGIQRLVSSSVPELMPSQVTISDQRGTTLSKKHFESDSLLTGVSERMQKKKEVEDYYQEKIKHLLEDQYGASIRISVNVDMSFDEVVITRDGVADDIGGVGSGIVRKRELITEPNGKVSNKSSSSETHTKEVEYILARQVEKINKAPGQISRINVGIVIKSKLSKEEKRNIHELVSMAAGLNQSRGDHLVISDIQSKITLDNEGGISADISYESEVSQEPIDTNKINDHKNTQEISVLVDFLKNNIIHILLGFFVMLLGVAVVLSQWFRHRSQDNNRLSDHDREELLNQVRTWLDSDEKQEAIESNA